ncbi:Amine oxidase [Priestia megaterium]
MPGSKGTIKTISDAICLHEEDYGIAWKHKDWRIEEVEARSSRLLTIFSA